MTEEGIPTIDEFDFEDVDNFLDTFDSYERATIKARNKICSVITDAYLGSTVGNDNKQDQGSK